MFIDFLCIRIARLKVRDGSDVEFVLVDSMNESLLCAKW